jgi:hypothetical protein
LVLFRQFGRHADRPSGIRMKEKAVDHAKEDDTCIARDE